MKKHFFLKSGVLIITLFMSQFALAKPAGTVTFITGDVNITHADKTVTQAAKNDALNAGDTIETRNGRLQLALIDGGRVSLQPNSIYKINKYEFSGKEDGTEYGFTELIKGGLRTISGFIGHKNPDRYQLKTAVATIGIRGTEFTVNFNDDILLMTTNHGSVDVCNTGGCLNAITGESIEVAGIGAAPKPSGKKAKAAAAPPESSKTVFALTDAVTGEGIPKFVDDANSSPTGTIPVAIPASAGTTGGVAGGTGGVTGGVTGVGTVSVSGTGTGTIAGNATIVSLATMQAGLDNNGVYTGTTTFTGNAGNGKNPGAGKSPNGNALKQYVDNSGTPNILTGTILEANSDAFVKWGRASGGTYNGQTMLMTNWVTGIATPSSAISALNLAGTTGLYNVTASTAPYMVSGATVSAVGATNSVTGSMSINFGSYTYNYNLNVPISGTTFTLTNAGTSGSLIPGNATFRSAGTCTPSCSGLLFGGALVEGAIFGANAQAIGLQYGFSTSGAGNVYGAAVLK